MANINLNVPGHLLLTKDHYLFDVLRNWASGAKPLDASLVEFRLAVWDQAVRINRTMVDLRHGQGFDNEALRAKAMSVATWVWENVEPRQTPSSARPEPSQRRPENLLTDIAHRSAVRLRIRDGREISSERVTLTDA